MLKTTSKKNLKKIGYIFFDRYFYIKNYGDDLRHHRQMELLQFLQLCKTVFSCIFQVDKVFKFCRKNERKKTETSH